MGTKKAEVSDTVNHRFRFRRLKKLFSRYSLALVIVYGALVAVNFRMHLGQQWVIALVVSVLLMLLAILTGRPVKPGEPKLP